LLNYRGDAKKRHKIITTTIIKISKESSIHISEKTDSMEPMRKFFKYPEKYKTHYRDVMIVVFNKTLCDIQGT
jgi:hypothetical protein